MESNWTTGPTVEVTPAHQRAGTARFAAAQARAAVTGDHVWVAVAGYLVTPPDQLNLDHENITGPPAVGCYVCEVAWNPRLAKRRCPGDPG